MVQIRPFRSLHYNTSRFSDWNSLVFQRELPFDFSGLFSQRRLYPIEKILARIDKTDPKNSYQEARKLLRDFQRNNILIRDQYPFIYVYYISYQNKISGLKMVRRGFVALGKIEPYSALQEVCFTPPEKEIFLQLLQSTMMLFSPIVMLYQDPQNQINELLESFCEQQDPCLEVQYPQKETHQLFRISRRECLKEVMHLMDSQTLLQMNLDPGYLALQEFKKEMSEKKFHFDWGMMLFFNLFDTVLFPTPHRLLKNILNLDHLQSELNQWFEVKYYPFEIEADFSQAKQEFFEDLRIEGYGHKHFGIFFAGEKKFQLLKMKEKEVSMSLSEQQWPNFLKKLDAMILDRFLIKKMLQHQVQYLSDIDDALQNVLQGEYQVVFFLNSLTSHQLKEVLQEKQIFPPGFLGLNTTPLAGLLIQPLEEEGEALS
ncbi:MAG: DUF1015 family protein [Planctomycetota bacterium]